MLVNLVSLTIKADKKFLSFHPVNDDMVAEAKESKYQSQASARWLVLNRGGESSHAMDCLTGKAEYYPYFDDLSHLVKLHPGGITEYSVSDQYCQRYNFIFPGAELIPYIKMALWRAEHMPKRSEYNSETGKAVIVVPQSTIINWRIDNAPCYRWEHSQNWYGGIDVSVESKLEMDKSTDGLTRCLDSLIRIAHNHSDGQPSVIHVGFDGAPSFDRPSNYGFCVTSPSGKRIINGGIIAHRQGADDSYQYSTHT